MLIGVCFFGRIKYFDRTYLINSFNPNHEYNFFYSGDNEPEHLINEFKEIYKPISLNNDKISYDIDFGIYPNDKTYPPNIHNMTCHFINKKRVFRLLEEHCNITNKSYDLIVSSRLDLYMHNYSPEIPLKNTIYIPNGEDHTGINDRIAFGDFQTMKHYMNLYDNCVYLLKNKICVPHPETLHLYNILHYKINIVRINLYHEIIR
jgi:hypothetical protein